MPKKQKPERDVKPVPDVCRVCGQKVDKRSAASIAHHATAKHMPYLGKRKPAGWA
ncbi:MAG TPA: hypothetical protein VK641_13490 [Terriglobales bacterium]|nr:hypothetical protein [Terriglobales bacterium]